MHILKIYPDKDTKLGRLVGEYKEAWLAWNSGEALVVDEAQEAVNEAFLQAAVDFPHLDFKDADLSMGASLGVYGAPYFIIRVGGEVV